MTVMVASATVDRTSSGYIRLAIQRCSSRQQRQSQSYTKTRSQSAKRRLRLIPHNGEQQPEYRDRSRIIQQAFAFKDCQQPTRRADFPECADNRPGVRRRDGSADQETSQSAIGEASHSITPIAPVAATTARTAIANTAAESASSRRTFTASVMSNSSGGKKKYSKPGNRALTAQRTIGRRCRACPEKSQTQKSMSPGHG